MRKMILYAVCPNAYKLKGTEKTSKGTLFNHT